MDKKLEEKVKIKTVLKPAVYLIDVNGDLEKIYEATRKHDDSTKGSYARPCMYAIV